MVQVIVPKYGEDRGIDVRKLLEAVMGVAYGGVYGQVGIVSLCMWLSLLERITVYSFGMTVGLGISL